MVRVQTQAMKIRAVCRRLLRDTRGVTLVVVALTLTALVGVAGLGVETGLWYMVKRYNQSAADVGALSGVMELAAKKPYADICNFAGLAVKANGFTFVPSGCSSGCTSPPAESNNCVNNPPVTPGSENFGNNNAVEVILAQQQNTFFASLFMPSVTVETRAVASIRNLSTCLLALSAKGTDLDYKGGGHGSLTIPNCAFASDSGDPTSIDLRGNFDITAGAIDTVGGYSIKGAAGTVSPGIVTGAALLVDPYSGVTVGALPPGPCSPANVAAGNVTLVPGTAYCSLTISGGNVNIPAGVYYLVGTPGNWGGMPGDLSISGGSVNGSGVTFVLTAQPGVSAAGTVQITGGSGSLSAPTVSGLLPPSAATSVGLLIFQDPATSANSGSNKSATGCPAPPASGLSLTGAIDTSLTEDTMQGNPTSCSACTELIAARFHLGGTPALDTSGCAAVGTKTANVSVIRLAE
jgi:Flp pilus assembly protein TadG